MSSKKTSPSSSTTKISTKITRKYIKQDYASSWDEILKLKSNIRNIYREIYEAQQVIRNSGEYNEELFNQIGQLFAKVKKQEFFVIDLVRRSNKVMSKKRRSLIQTLKDLEVETDLPWSGDPDDYLIIVDHNKTKLPNLSDVPLSNVIIGLELDQRNDIHMYGNINLTGYNITKEQVDLVRDKISELGKRDSDIEVSLMKETEAGTIPSHLVIKRKITKDLKGQSERETFGFYSELSDVVKEIMRDSEEIIDVMD